MKQLAALSFAALLLAACERGHPPAPAAPASRSTTEPVPASAAAAVNLAEAAANVTAPPLPADVDPDNPYAVFAARAAAAKAAESRGARINYGVLGDPLNEPLEWEEHDRGFFSQTTQQKLRLFRRNEQPSSGPMDGPTSRRSAHYRGLCSTRC
jgi:hypothetical protein